VVVGVDRSPAAKAAVRFAVDEALARDAPLVGVHAHRVPAYRSDDTEYDAVAAEGLLAEEILPYARQHPQLKVELRALESNNVEKTMIEATRDAALAVVGRRGTGGFAGLLLGSVSRALVHHAYAPVAVIHPSEQ
jgi:nucleotide-binding universal stress UspA family protein